MFKYHSKCIPKGKGTNSISSIFQYQPKKTSMQTLQLYNISNSFDVNFNRF